VPTPEDHQLAAHLAQEAGEQLLRLREELTAQDAVPARIKDDGDRSSHEWLMGQLRAERPEDAVLSEEARADERNDARRLRAARVWIIDPLDGTREYGEGRADWAVHVALVEDGTPTVGAVALPAEGIVLSTAEVPEVPAAGDPLRVVVSRSRPPEAATRIASSLRAELVEMGSAGAKAMSILLGRSDVYPHSGGQFEWDSAAPVAVATAAGLHCSRLDGSPLVYNRVDSYLPDLLICRPEHAAAVIAASS
jgi:3'(2'), 5'-bisphosphate nucleotidase